MMRKRGSEQVRQVKIGDEEKIRLKMAKMRGGGVLIGGWEDKQHRRKKMQVRHLVFPKAILKQDSAGASLYE